MFEEEEAWLLNRTLYDVDVSIHAQFDYTSARDSHWLGPLDQTLSRDQLAPIHKFPEKLACKEGWLIRKFQSHLELY